MSEIYFIRHGQASFGQENYDRLSPAGIRQARLLGRHLARLDRSFNAVICGTLERQQHTAGAMIDAFGENGSRLPSPHTNPAFDEFDSQAVWLAILPQVLDDEPGAKADLDQMLADRRAFQRLFQQVMERWITDRYDSSECPGWQDFTGRVRTGIETLTNQWGSEKRLAVVSSGGPISVAVQMALGLSDANTISLTWQIANASVSRFKYSHRGIALAGFNDVAHLELEKDPQLITYR